MSDRELLELAAKAAGLVIDKTTTNGGGSGNTGFDALGSAVLDWHNGKKWNPLVDDGDALRLAVELGIDILTDDDDKQAGTIMPNGGNGPWVACTENSYAAVRRAIVLAASEIGRKMT